ncbi:Fe-S cluster assembly protein SufD [Risungbinella massiliensis]|uniref:Fe-S cluster assembly protein SufD n=1 Tax=Risungbinella massiliensis TaxID=1329796 RepID=UPI0005CC4873|nr:Fe-S cluster assembly protein SufD [Risungbinella massiliensis]
MTMQTQIDLTKVAELSSHLQEPNWLLELRQAALQKAAELPLPQLEKTNLNRWNFSDFSLPILEEKAGELPSYAKDFLFVEDKGSLFVQHNGSVYQLKVDDESSQKGVIFCDIATAAVKHEELLKKYFMTQATKMEEHRLTALHTALFSGGLFVYVPRNVEVTLPMHALFVLEGKGIGTMPHVLVVAEENSRVEVITNFVANPEAPAALQNAVVEVIVGENAQVRVATVNDQTSETVDAMFRRALVKRDGRMEWTIADLSEGHMISHTKVQLPQTGGSVEVNSVALGTKELRANFTTEIEHVGTHTASNINTRSVMKDKANSILNSITKIEKGATKADGQQSGKVLMLNPAARGDANPILLIDENDVTAGHAASVGRIDPIQLFYLMSRGISQAEAERLVTLGFLDAVIANIPSEELRKRIYQLMERKLLS